jgi:hypothetical protein
MGTVHKECVPAGQAANQYYDTEILERLRNRVMRVRRNIAQNWILRHDNVPEHAGLSVAHVWTSKCITAMLQHLYSTRTLLFFLFQKVKLAVRGHHFESTEDIQRVVTRALNDIPQAAFQECYNSSATGKGVCRHKGCTLKVHTL